MKVLPVVVCGAAALVAVTGAYFTIAGRADVASSSKSGRTIGSSIPSLESSSSQYPDETIGPPARVLVSAGEGIASDDRGQDAHGRYSLRVVDATGNRPIVDALVVRVKGAESVTSRCGLRTDAQGHVTIAASEYLPANLMVFKNGYLRQFTPASPDGLKEIALRTGITVSGRVVESEGRRLEGAISVLAIPVVAGVGEEAVFGDFGTSCGSVDRISVVPSAVQAQYAHVDLTTGEFAVGGLVPGTYGIFVHALGYVDLADDVPSKMVDVTGDRSGLEIRLRRSAVVEVVGKNISGEVIPGALAFLEFADPAHGVMYFPGRREEAGGSRFGDLGGVPEGTLQARVRAFGYFTTTSDNQIEVRGSSARPDRIEVTLPDAPSVNIAPIIVGAGSSGFSAHEAECLAWRYHYDASWRTYNPLSTSSNVELDYLREPDRIVATIHEPIGEDVRLELFFVAPGAGEAIVSWQPVTERRSELYPQMSGTSPLSVDVSEFVRTSSFSDAGCRIRAQRRLGDGSAILIFDSIRPELEVKTGIGIEGDRLSGFSLGAKYEVSGYRGKELGPRIEFVADLRTELSLK